MSKKTTKSKQQEEKSTQEVLNDFAAGADFKMPAPRETQPEIDPDSLPSEDVGAPEDFSEKENIEEETREDEDFNNLSYKDRLHKLEISDDEATEVIDAMCEEGFYMEDVVLRKAREGKKALKAVFITRDTRTQGFITEKVSMEHRNIPIIYNKLMGELQLAGSIIHYKGETFDPLSEIEDDKEFQEELMRRVHLFSKFPAPITVVLTRALSKFDLKVGACLAPGYEDFF